MIECVILLHGLKYVCKLYYRREDNIAFRMNKLLLYGFVIHFYNCNIYHIARILCEHILNSRNYEVYITPL